MIHNLLCLASSSYDLLKIIDFHKIVTDGLTNRLTDYHRDTRILLKIRSYHGFPWVSLVEKYQFRCFLINKAQQAKVASECIRKA